MGGVEGSGHEERSIGDGDGGGTGGTVEAVDDDLSLIKKGNLNELVAERASNAFMAGADGIICSPLETNLIRSKDQFSNKIIVTPGIRLNYSGNEDQKRISTPSKALKAGADYIVVGRPIWNAKDPILAVDDILNNMCNNV